MSRRVLPAVGALASVALLTSAVTATGGADAARRALENVVSKPQPRAVLRLDARARFPASVVPKVRAARNADRLDGRPAEEYLGRCGALSVDLGSWCLMAQPFAVPNEDIGKNDYFYATQTCVEAGGWLPTAAQLIGAAQRVKLASTIDDNRLTASIDEDASDGRKDRREMSSTLVTTQAGSAAAGSQGVTDGSRGDAKQREPDPVTQPANPQPETLQYVTVYDNRDKGGFAGSRSVAQPEIFRCAFSKVQGPIADEEG